MLVAKDAKHFVNVREGTDDLYVSIDSVGVGSLGRYGQPTARPWNYCDRPIDQAFTVFFCLVPGLTAIACGLVLALRRFEGALDAPARPLTILSVGMCGVLIILASDAATWLIGHGFLFGRVTSRIGFLLAIWAMALQLHRATFIRRCFRHADSSMVSTRRLTRGSRYSDGNSDSSRTSRNPSRVGTYWILPLFCTHSNAFGLNVI